MNASIGAAHRLYVELTLTAEDPAELAAAGYDWLTFGLVEALSEEPWTGTPSAGEGRARQGRDPVARWQALDVPKGSALVVDQRDERLQERAATAAALPWLRAEVLRRPRKTTLRVGPSCALSVSFEQDRDDFVNLGWEVEEQLFSSPSGPLTADSALRTLWYAASRHHPVFGHVSYGNMGGRTELERNLPRMVGNPYLNIPRWREFLRGYSWWMVVPGELLGRVGGTAALRGSDAFHEVLELPGGEVWLRATARFVD